MQNGCKETHHIAFFSGFGGPKKSSAVCLFLIGARQQSWKTTYPKLQLTQKPPGLLFLVQNLVITVDNIVLGIQKQPAQVSPL